MADNNLEIVPVEVLTPEEKLQRELTVLDKYDLRIAELEKQYGSLTIKDVSDKEGYEQVRVAIGELRSIRTGSEKEKDQYNRFYIDAQRAFNKKFKWIEENVKRIEDKLRKRKEEIDFELSEAKRKKQEAENTRYITRVQDLTRMGVQLVENHFVFEGIQYEAGLIKGCDDDLYTEMYNRFKAAFDKIEEARLEQERKDQEEKDKLLKEKEEFERQKEELEKAQKQLALMQQQLEQDKRLKEDTDREAERIRLQQAADQKRLDEANLWARRFSELDDVKWMPSKQAVSLKYEGFSISWDDMITLPDEEFNMMRDLHNSTNAGAKKKLEEATLAKIEEDRKIALDLDRELERQKAFKEEKERQAELDKAGDKDKWLYFISQVDNLRIPEMKSNLYKSRINAVKETIIGWKNLVGNG